MKLIVFYLVLILLINILVEKCSIVGNSQRNRKPKENYSNYWLINIYNEECLFNTMHCTQQTINIAAENSFHFLSLLSMCFFTIRKTHNFIY